MNAPAVGCWGRRSGLRDRWYSWSLLTCRSTPFNSSLVALALSQGLCGNHKENHRQLVETIKASPHFQRSRGADHLLVASDWQAAGYLDREEEDPLSLEKTVIGHRPIPLMKHVPSFSVGYGTAPALMRLWAVHNYSSQVHHYLEGKREEEGKPQEGVTSRSHRKLLSTGGQADDNDDDDIEGNDFIDAEHGWRAFGWDEYRGNDGDGGGEGGGDAFGLNDDMPTLLPGPKHSNRRYLFSALMQLDGRPAYKTRRTFMCSWQTLPARIKHTPGYTNAEKRKAIYTLRHRFPIFLHRASKFINRIGFVNRATIPIFNPCTSNMGTWDQRHHSHVPDGAMKLLLHPPGKYGRLSHHRKSVHPAEHANHTELTPEELEAGLRQDRQPVTKAVKYLAQSRAVLSLRGDTPMTDRDSLVFETLSLKLELEDNIERLLPMLPFTDVVPWRDLILAIKVRHPWTMAEDILYAMQGISRAEWNRRVKLMAQYRKDVLWAMPGIRTHQNVMRNALAAAKAWKKPVAAPQRQQPQRIPWYKSARGDSPRTIPAEAPKLAVARASLPDLPRQRLGVNGASSAKVKKWERFHQEQEETVRGSRVESLKQELRKRVQGKPPRFYTAAERERYAKQIRSTGRTGWMR